MVDGVLGLHGHHAAELVVVGANTEEDLAIIHHQDMVGLVALAQFRSHRDVILIVAQVSNYLELYVRKSGRKKSKE